MKYARSISALCALAAAGTAAAHDDGKGRVGGNLLAMQAAVFEGVVAENSNEGSNAPAAHAPCIQGLAAGQFPCSGVDMLGFVPGAEMGFSFVNDMWGWTDPDTGRDYALVSGTEGMSVVDVTDPKRPVIMGLLPSDSDDPRFPFWRDIKVYGNHAYVGSEHEDHGVQVFDLTDVRGAEPGTTFAAATVYRGAAGDITQSHNLAINEETASLYVVGSDDCNRGGLHMVDISDPENPTFAGCYSEQGYIHDTQCVIYRGPDADHQGREICFNSGAVFDGTPYLNTLGIVDVTDKANPVTIAITEYPNDGYSHQGWLTPDHTAFLHNDELDEAFGQVDGTTTRIFDVTDLDNPVLTSTVDHGTTAIGHNAYTEGLYAYVSNYTSGLRVFDISLTGEGELPEVAFFDVYPENENTSFEGGTWSNYPYFKQKKLVGVSSMERGLFLLQPRLGAN